jgi:hypothetical protein
MSRHFHFVVPKWREQLVFLKIIFLNFKQLLAGTEVKKKYWREVKGAGAFKIFQIRKPGTFKFF